MSNRIYEKGWASTIRVMLRRLRYEIREYVSQYPCLYGPLIRRREANSDYLVSDDTEFVIQAFPRSGNTFAERAFEFAQTRPIKFAHHIHAVAEIIGAARRAIPMLIIIRDPDETVLSNVIATSDLTLKQLFRHYTRFYQHTQSYRPGFVVATFDEVTSDFGAVIRRVNKAFGTDFGEFEHTDENVRKCFKLMDDHNRKTGAPVAVGHPSEERKKLKDKLRSELHTPKLEPIRSQAYHIYEVFRFYAQA